MQSGGPEATVTPAPERAMKVNNSLPSSVHYDVEKNSDYAHLSNTSVRSYAWDNISVTVKDRETKRPTTILNKCSGVVNAGEMLAIMGPSGCGKTTLLNVLAHREPSGSTIEQTRLLNGSPVSAQDFRRISCYVEQEEALLGVLTVRETLYFAAKLSLPSSVGKAERMNRIEALIAAFGLQSAAEVLVGTPIRKGISGGQKRRLSVASQLITSPKVIFLDEPTSGLDSRASYEVMSFVKNIATKYHLLVIASIHQPSTATFMLFDKLLLLSRGCTVYGGAVSDLASYFARHGDEMPEYTNPAEYALELVNTDFAGDQDQAETKLQHLLSQWDGSTDKLSLKSNIDATKASPQETGLIVDDSDRRSIMQQMTVPAVLVHRSFIKSYRDVFAYGIRIAMYMCLAIMAGTVWLRLAPTQENITAFTNSIFFGGAFMSFMAVAYIPAYMEDRAVYLKERSNGLYGPAVFLASNFFIGLVFLLIITIFFAAIVYWLTNFQPTAEAFWVLVMWLYLDLLAAESLVILITNICPVFVVALAAVAFTNGLWMCVGGFMVQPDALNVFYRYVFHYIDYQAYVFQGMMVNEFKNRVYDCDKLSDGSCHCIYVTELQDQCKIDGRGVLAAYGYNPNKAGLWVGIMIGIIVAYRLLGWLVLFLRKH